jgi:DNA repair protein RadC
LLVDGAQGLSDAELLGLLIGSGPVGKRAEEVGGELLELVEDGLDGLGRLPPEAYCLVRGIGIARAVKISAAMELGRRRRERGSLLSNEPAARITTAHVVHGRFKSRLADLNHEEFWVLLLRRSNVVLAEVCISKGGLAGTVVDPKLVFGKALAMRAAAVILIHNHPSGTPRPSVQDRKLTERLKAAGDFLDCPVLDHVIVACDQFFSFADAGEL